MVPSKIFILLRLVHLLSTMFTLTTIAVVIFFDVDIVEYDFYRSKLYKMLGHYSGLLMIFSGIVIMILMRRQLEREHAHTQTADLNAWLKHFTYKFFLGVLITPFVDRIARLINFGVATSTPSSQDEQFFDKLLPSEREQHLALELQIA